MLLLGLLLFCYGCYFTRVACLMILFRIEIPLMAPSLATKVSFFNIVFLKIKA